MFKLHHLCVTGGEPKKARTDGGGKGKGSGADWAAGPHVPVVAAKALDDDNKDGES